MKNLSIAGRVGRDADLKHATSGTALLRFSVAVDSRKGSERVTTWFSCTVFGKRAEALAKHITKGTVVAVSGDLEVRTYEKDGATKVDIGIVVAELSLLGGGNRDQSRAESASGGNYDFAPAQDFGGGGFDDGEVPF